MVDMPDAIELQNLFIGTMAGAAIVLLGAFYALFYALGKQQNHRGAAAAALLSYAALVGATYLFAQALALSGFWIFVTVVMLIGYFVAPRIVWRLCVGVHA